MTSMLWSALALGFVLGLRHAMDPDHVIAVSTIVGEEPNWRRSSMIGSFWGLGHATSLLILGGLIIALRISITEAAASRLEILVSVMLVGLGIYAVRAAHAGFRVHAHKHTHEDARPESRTEHVHLHLHQPHAQPIHQHAHPLRFGLRPFAIGLVHGVAGSGSLALLVMATAKTAAAGLLYMLALAFGAMVGMGILSALLTLPLSALRSRYQTLHLRFQFLSGLGSVAFGLWLFSVHLAEFL